MSIALFEPMMNAAQESAMLDAVHRRRHGNVLVRVAFGWPADVGQPHLESELRHYLEQCAFAVEVEMRNRRGERQVGAEHHDVKWAVELGLVVHEHQTKLVRDTENFEIPRSFIEHNRRFLMLYMKLERLVTGRSVPSFSDDIPMAQEFFFGCFVHFASIRAMCMLPEPRQPVCPPRLPCHEPAPPSLMLEARAALNGLELSRPTRPELTPEIYVHEVQCFLQRHV